jgi:integrase
VDAASHLWGSRQATPLPARTTRSSLAARRTHRLVEIRVSSHPADQGDAYQAAACQGGVEPIGVKVVKMLRKDLKAAGIKPVDERGTKIVFHSLRYTLSAALDQTGASLKERMTILRHSDKGNLTLGTYTTLEVIDLRGAIERLPDCPWPTAAAEQQRQEKVARC